MAKSKVDNDRLVEFSQAMGALVRRLRTAGAIYELSWTESSVLVRLSKNGPATTADLARAEGVKPQSMGTTIATLEERGLIRRKPHPTDGRQMMIELTEEGAEVRDNTRNAKRSWLAQATSHLSPAEQETLLAAGEIMRKLVDL